MADQVKVELPAEWLEPLAEWVAREYPGVVLVALNGPDGLFYGVRGTGALVESDGG